MNKKKRTIKNIEKEMSELYPKKELAYIDYTDNRGDEDIRNQLWGEFIPLRDKWNKLVAERKAIKKNGGRKI